METGCSKKDLIPSGEVKSSYFGIDLHKDQITWHCIMRLIGGEIVRMNGKVFTDRIIEDFVPILTKENCYVIVEASCSTFFFHSLIKDYCTQAIAINPLAFREMFMTGKKTDKIDAKKLADRLMYHIEMADADDNFPEVTVPDIETQKIRKLISSYEFIVKQITQIKNHFKAIFRAKIISYNDDSLNNSIDHVLTHPKLDAADCDILRSLKSIYDTLCIEKETIKKAILKIGVHRFESETKLLTSIPGIGVLGAVVFMADIINVARFKSAKHMTSYLASVGKVDASGKTTKNGGLNKRGRRTSYRFILQGLEHVINGNELFQNFKERHKSKKSNKVRAAIVRKTFVAMFYMLKNNEMCRYENKSIYERKLKEIERVLKNVA